MLMYHPALGCIRLLPWTMVTMVSLPDTLIRSLCLPAAFARLTILLELD